MTARPSAVPTAWLAAQRWYAADLGTEDPDATSAPSAQTTEPVALEPSVSVELPTRPPLAVDLVDAGGSRYQLLRGVRDPDKRPDLAADPEAGTALARFVSGSGTATAGGASIRARWLTGTLPLGPRPARPLGAEQSNTSLVVGGTHALKLFRRVQPGPHPEVEIGRHLAAVAADGRIDEPLPVAGLSGWWEVDSDGQTTVLGVVQELVAGAVGAWSLTLSGIAGDPGELLAGLHRMGRDLAVLHDALALPAADAAEGDDPARFGTRPVGPADVDELVGGIGTAAEALTALPLGTPLDPDRIVALGRSLAAGLEGALGSSIRTHGDLHLGQIVLGGRGWAFLDFEGEPARSLEERRRRSSPLRDVAGMLRSFAYAAATHRRSDGPRLPGGWEAAARASFLDGYLAAVDPALLPPSAADTARLLALFELEKVVYELGYEAAHRPDWVPIPEEGLERLLAQHALSPNPEVAP